MLYSHIKSDVIKIDNGNGEAVELSLEIADKELTEKIEKNAEIQKERVENYKKIAEQKKGKSVLTPEEAPKNKETKQSKPTQETEAVSVESAEAVEETTEATEKTPKKKK